MRVLNSYHVFFRTTQPALYATFIVKLSSVFGARPDEITLKDIPGAERESSFEALWQRGRRLHKIRSKLIAHRDTDIHSRNYARESGFTYDDLKALLTDTCRFFDSAAERLDIAPVHVLSCKADLLRLVHDLGTERS